MSASILPVGVLPRRVRHLHRWGMVPSKHIAGFEDAWSYYNDRHVRVPLPLLHMVIFPDRASSGLFVANGWLRPIMQMNQ